MSRNQEFQQGAARFEQMHPNMHDYPHEVGNTGKIESSVGYVSVKALRWMHGNATDQEGIDRHRAKIRSGEGFTDPLMVEFDPDRRVAVVGEGNHRLEALHQEGISHAPVRVVRSRIRDDIRARKGGFPQPVDARSPWYKRHYDGSTVEYWPPSIHPRHIFPKDTL